MSLKWYVLRTYSGHEKKVKANIEKFVKSAEGMDGCIGQINVPTIQVAEMKNGKKRVVEKKFMPGYIIAQLDLLREDLIFRIQEIPSVSGFVGRPAPQPLTEEEVRNLMQGDASLEGETEETQEGPVTRMLFQVGEQVKIVDGPFANFTGVIDEIMPEKAKLRVRVEIFGQATPVDLDYLQVASNVS